MNPDNIIEFDFNWSKVASGMSQMNSFVSTQINEINGEFDKLVSKKITANGIMEFSGGLASVDSRLATVSTRAETLLGHLDRMSTHFTSGLGIGAAVGGFALLERAFDRGIEKARQFQTAQISIAATLTSVGQRVAANGQALSQPDQFQVNLNYARDLQQRLLDASTRNHLKFEEQVGAFQSSIASGARKGLNIDQIFNVSDLGAMAAKSLNLHGEQIANATRLLTGGGVNVGRSTIGRALGITNQDIALRSGNELYGFLTEKLKGFQAAQDEFGSSIEGIISTVESKVDTLMARVGMRFFNAVRPTVARFLDAFDDPVQGKGAASGSNGFADPNETSDHFAARAAQHIKDAEAINRLTDSAATLFTKLFNALAQVVSSPQFSAFVSFLETVAGYADKIVLAAVFLKIANALSSAKVAGLEMMAVMRSMEGVRTMSDLFGGLAHGGISNVTQRPFDKGAGPLRDFYNKADHGLQAGGRGHLNLSGTSDSVTAAEALAGRLALSEDESIEAHIAFMREMEDLDARFTESEKDTLSRISNAKEILAEAAPNSLDFIRDTDYADQTGLASERRKGESERAWKRRISKGRMAKGISELPGTRMQEDRDAYNQALEDHQAWQEMAQNELFSAQYDLHENERASGHNSDAYNLRKQAGFLTPTEMAAEDRIEREKRDAHYADLLNEREDLRQHKANLQDIMTNGGLNSSDLAEHHETYKAVKERLASVEEESASLAPMSRRQQLVGFGNGLAKRIGGGIAMLPERLMSGMMFAGMGLGIDDVATDQTNPFLHIGGQALGGALIGGGAGSLFGPAGTIAGTIAGTFLDPLIHSLQEAKQAAQDASDALDQQQQKEPYATKVISDRAGISRLRAGLDNGHQVGNNVDVSGLNILGHIPGVGGLFSLMGSSAGQKGLTNLAQSLGIDLGSHTEFGSSNLSLHDRRSQMASLQSDIARQQRMDESAQKYKTNYDGLTDQINKLTITDKTASLLDFTDDSRRQKLKRDSHLVDLKLQQRDMSGLGVDTPEYAAMRTQVERELYNPANPNNAIVMSANNPDAFRTMEGTKIAARLSTLSRQRMLRDQALNKDHLDTQLSNMNLTHDALIASTQQDDTRSRYDEALAKAQTEASESFGGLHSAAGQGHIQDAMDKFFDGVADKFVELKQKIESYNLDQRKEAFKEQSFYQDLPYDRQEVIQEGEGRRRAITRAQLERARLVRQQGRFGIDEKELGFQDQEAVFSRADLADRIAEFGRTSARSARDYNRSVADRPERNLRDRFGADDASDAETMFYGDMGGGIGKAAAAIRAAVDAQYAGQFNPAEYKAAYERKVQREIAEMRMTAADARKKPGLDAENDADQDADFLAQRAKIKRESQHFLLEQAQQDLADQKRKQAHEDLTDKEADNKSAISDADFNITGLKLALDKGANALARFDENTTLTIDSFKLLREQALAAAKKLRDESGIMDFIHMHPDQVNAALNAQTNSTGHLNTKVRKTYDQSGREIGHTNASGHTINVPIQITTTHHLDPKEIQAIVKKSIEDRIEQEKRKPR